MAAIIYDRAQHTRTRTRSGCLNCRSGRKKCDATRPQCSQCRGRGEACCYGVKASFHPSRELTLSNTDSAALLAVEEERGVVENCEICFVDDTLQIVGSYQGPFGATPRSTEARRESQNRTSRSTPSAQSESLVVQSTFWKSGITRSGESDGDVPSTEVDATTTESLRDRAPDAMSLQATANDSNHSDLLSSHGSSPTRSLSPITTFIAPAYFDVELPVPESEQAHLICTYLQGPGIWCEATDPDRNFTISCVHKLMANKPFAAAAMALASRQLDGACRNPRSSTIRLYQHAVQLLLHYEPSQCGDTTLVCCALLSVYEMMTSDFTEWRRHLKVSLQNLFCLLVS